MRASSNRLVTGDDGLYGRAPAGRPADGSPPSALRASDAERDHAIGELRNQYAVGRLSQDTFLGRMDAALRAKERAELSDLFTDLPQAQQRGFGQALRRRLATLRQRTSRPDRGRGHYPAVPPQPEPRPQSPRPEPASLLTHAPGSAGWQVLPVASTTAGLPPKPLCLPRHEDRQFTIGRAPTCDFTVADMSVSRWHARLQREDDSWLLSDLGSTNGTRLNGWRVTQSVQVQAGDEVSFGTVTFVVTDRPVAKYRPEAVR
jgi:Inner membrane component of T3SS, cytoplasmic domain/Domain of unknown function (DUF1707)